MDRLISFVRRHTLVSAMVLGCIIWLCYAKLPFMQPLKPATDAVLSFLTPALIFCQLLLTFCKVERKDLTLFRWHLKLAIFQVSITVVLSLLLLFVPMGEEWRVMFEGFMVCMICPTATAGAVVTARLGGSAARITTYTLAINAVVSVIVPLLFPLVHPHEGFTFFAAFLRMLYKVFPLLIMPLICAILLRKLLPRWHGWLKKHADAAFYIWAVALTIVIGQTLRSLFNSPAPWSSKAMVAFGALVACIIQFAFGKMTGSKENDTITAGQALGQKNTVFAIWMAYTYLTPLSSVAPGAYVLWQNLFNAWQISRHDKMKEAGK